MSLSSRKMGTSIMARPRIGGGIRKSLPLKERESIGKRLPIAGTNIVYFSGNHEEGQFHQARSSRIPHISWAIYRLRRARVGQGSLFGSKRVLSRKRKATCTIPFWGWGIPAPTKRKANHAIRSA